MTGIFRKHQQPIMIFVTIFVIIGFVAFYNGSARSLDRMSSDRIATIYGSRSVSRTDAEAIIRKYQVAMSMGMNDLVRSLATLDRGEHAWENMLVIEHEGARLQIEPTEEDIEEAERHMPIFQTNGQFDVQKLNYFVAVDLPPAGFTATQMEEIIKTGIVVQRLKDLLASTATVTPAQLRLEYEEANQKLDLSLIRFKLADLPAVADIAEDQLRKAYDQKKNDLNAPEKRTVKEVFFGLTEDQKKLTGKDRTDVLQKLADSANDFSQAMLEKNANFDEQAKKSQVAVQNSVQFTQADLDPKRSKNSELARAAFGLTTQDPNSDPVSTDDGFYILQLTDVTPVRPLTFEEAKPQLAQELKNNYARENLSLKAAAVRAKIISDMQSGRTFQEAAAAQSLQVEKIPPFSLSEEKLDFPDAQTIAQKAVGLNAGELSEVVNSPDNSILIYLEKREPIDPAVYAKEKDAFAGKVLAQLHEFVFQEWLRTERVAAHVQEGRPG